MHFPQVVLLETRVLIQFHIEPIFNNFRDSCCPYRVLLRSNEILICCMKSVSIDNMPSRLIGQEASFELA